MLLPHDESVSMTYISSASRLNNVIYDANRVMAVRTIDVSALFGSDAEPKRALAREWDACLKSVGFAIIVGHNVPESVETTLYDAAKQFFHLPEPDKLKAALNARQYGPGGYVTKGSCCVRCCELLNHACLFPCLCNFCSRSGGRCAQYRRSRSPPRHHRELCLS